MHTYTKPFAAIGIADLPHVGGKNASLGEMYSSLHTQGVRVPGGYAVTANGYWRFLDYNNLRPTLEKLLGELDTTHFSNLSEIGAKAREIMGKGQFPEDLKIDILQAHRHLLKEEGTETISFAIRSSATAEDLPEASFAGQQETFLNVQGEENLIRACHRCYASLFTDRAIKYRTDHGFDHMHVALSIGVQTMIRADLACSGVLFTIDPDSGNDQVVLISGAWGLGENVVQGNVNTDEFLVFKQALKTGHFPIISHKMGSKEKTMVYAPQAEATLTRPEEAVMNLPTSLEKQREFILSNEEIIQLAKWGLIIETHYKQRMDIEWAKDGLDGKLYIVQARPETVHQRKKATSFRTYTILEKGEKLCEGAGIGQKIVSGLARRLDSPKDIDKLQFGEILVTERTDPDWDPILKKASAIVTNQGGRTSHAAIVARELGAIAVIGTGNGTQTIQDGERITVSTATGNTGFVYRGALKWEEKEVDLSNLPKTKTKAMLILAHPDEAFRLAALPCDGVGLMRMEFIVSNAIGIHPMALRHMDRVTNAEVKAQIEAMTLYYPDKAEYFVDKLAEATAKMAAAFYPRDVVVRMSDFKSNEYANLLGGHDFEPEEENPMIGFRGASRYYHPLYKDAFELECRAMKKVRDTMGLTNVKLMIPFCRTLTEAEKVIETMKEFGLSRGKNGLHLFMMIEIPSNALLAEEFAQHFDGFSIGSNDLTQLTLGADRDSTLLMDTFSPFDPAVMQLIQLTLEKAKRTGTYTGLCGQAPSDYAEYAKFLVDLGIDSISFNPDALIKGIEHIALAETD
jgi:pyruvate, water dikinase